MLVKYSLGIDISADTFNGNLSVIDENQQVKVIASRKFANTMPGLSECDSWIAKHRKQKEVKMVVTMEATGVYYENCALFLFKKGYLVSVVLPNKAKKYLQATGLKSKNDKIDAKGLARMGAEQSLDPWQPMAEFYYQLRELTRQHQSLQEHRTMVLNQIHANEKGMFVNAFVIEQLKSMSALLDKQIESTEAAIKKHLDAEAEVAHKVKNISKIKGVGMLTIAILAAETNGFALFTTKSQLVSYAGYDVVEDQSGTHQGATRISKKGNGRIRRALHMPALGVVRWGEPPFYNIYKRTLEKHGFKMKSIVAVQKKLLVIIYSLWKNNEEYRSDYDKVKIQQMKKAA